MKLKHKGGFTLKGRVRATMRRAGEVVFCSDWQDNLITDVGIGAILRRFGNKATVANEGIITYGAVGSGAAAVDVGDTTMQSEIFRKLVGVSTVTGTTILFEVYFTNSEANDTITKWALFGEDATAAADSGTMFEHIAFAVQFTKTSAEDLTVEVEIVGATV